MKVARFLKRSWANGPGERSVVWFQGCTLGCKGCINQWSWSKDGLAEELSPAEIVARIPEEVEGVTLTGGEPFQTNILELTELCERLADRNQSVVIFTGYSLREIMFDLADRIQEDVLPGVDLLIAGRYDYTKKIEHPLLSSANQQLVFLGRYDQLDIDNLPSREFIVDLDSPTTIRTGVET